MAAMDRGRFLNEVCFLLAPGPMGDEFTTRGFQVSYIHWSSWRAPWALVKLYRLLRHGHYHIVHAYGLRANLLARVIGKLAGVPQIIGGLRSQYPSFKRNKLLFWLDRLTLPLARCYVANSQTAVDYLMSQGYPVHKFRVIHSGIEFAPFAVNQSDRSTMRRRHGLTDQGDPIIVCVARFGPGKGQETLLKALALLKDRRYHCLLVGDGPRRGQLEKLACELQLCERVEFLGARGQEEVLEILRSADVFVLPSELEGLPMAVMEAMAAALPVIATDVGGTHELVVESETGFLVPRGAASGLAERIHRLLDDPELRQQLGVRGRERIRQEFTLDKTVQAHEALYEELAQQ
jgi:glycosyltransferase involved in cell wall biosynthesis